MSRKTPSEPELQVIRAIAERGTIRGAAESLLLSAHTVDARLDRLREKSGFHYLPQLVAWAAKNGWLEFEAGK